MTSNLTKSWRFSFVTISIAFVVCQVIGTMCVLPDAASARQMTMFIEENMQCPMDATIMCPPSAISSPERQLKSGVALDPDDASILPNLVSLRSSTITPTPWSWSSVFSIVPLSIVSSCVLRI